MWWWEEVVGASEEAVSVDLKSPDRTFSFCSIDSLGMAAVVVALKMASNVAVAEIDAAVEYDYEHTLVGKFDSNWNWYWGWDWFWVWVCYWSRGLVKKFGFGSGGGYEFVCWSRAGFCFSGFGFDFWRGSFDFHPTEIGIAAALDLNPHPHSHHHHHSHTQTNYDTNLLA